MHWLADVYEEHKQALFLAAWTVLRRTDLAEDAVHLAAVKLLRSAACPENPKLYALKAVRHAALDLRQRDRRTPTQPLDSEEPGRGPLSVPNDHAEEIMALLESLDPASRQTVELHLFGGLTFQEVSAILGQPLPTVASRYRRSLEKMRQQLEPIHERH